MEFWQHRGLIAWLLWPLSLLYGALVRWRQRTAPGPVELPVPVLVVGNLTVGGNGKTPLVLWLAQRLAAKGYRPGIVSRGYGGRAAVYPQRVGADSDPAVVGDEPLLLAQRSALPVVVDPKRPRGAQHLIEQCGCDLIISDDGLQHHPLKRDIEIVAVDGERRFGNGLCLPAGPLREPLTRLQRVDFIVTVGRAEGGEFALELVGECAVNLCDPSRQRPLAAFTGPVHAVAAIGHPRRFFDHLKRAGLSPLLHPFRDHHPFCPADLTFGDVHPVIMTEKDAVKCRSFAAPHWWYLPVEARLDNAFEIALLERLAAIAKAAPVG